LKKAYNNAVQKRCSIARNEKAKDIGKARQRLFTEKSPVEGRALTKSHTPQEEIQNKDAKRRLRSVGRFKKDNKLTS